MHKYSGVEIAVIGMSGQFPGAENLHEFWDNLRKGKESISFFSEEEMAAENNALPVLPASYVKANAYLAGKEYFDSAFFSYLPSEAALMDPQMRLFHENCYKAIEDAGYDVFDNQEKIGLFAGGSPNTNWENYATIANMKNPVDTFSLSILSNITFLCSRISYLLNLQGPSVYINTACSTSLVAVQRACASLLLRECTMALAGGVTVKNFSKRGYVYQEGMINSIDGHCRAFDAEASGTVGSEGVGVVLLKRLNDAIRDRDHIYAVVRGTGINNDGSQKMSFQAPGVEGQYKAIHKAITMAGVRPETISYVEAHGTATHLGDPVEIEALNLAFGNYREKHCAIGSVKSNIGHADTAAGIAGFIKTVLSLKHRQIPPGLHFSSPNPAINFDNGPFFVNTKLTYWKNDNHPLRAGVSSFGIGGTNAHIILEEAPQEPVVSASRQHQLLVFSAKTPAALDRNINHFATALVQNDQAALADIAFTLQTGRSSFHYRKILVCENRAEAVQMIGAGNLVSGSLIVSDKVKPLIVFGFPGQGSQYANMCHDLFQHEIFFREELQSCFDIIQGFSGKDLSKAIFSENELLNQTEYTQPALFAIGYALARLLMQWGIQPGIMIGHSIGEYVAACISGVFSLEDALRLVVKRGELMQKTWPGKMAGISLAEEKVRAILREYPGLSLAAVNSPGQCVVSGEESAIRRFSEEMEKAGHTINILRTSHAFHSGLMEEILDEFEKEVKKVKKGKMQIPFISNLTGKLITDDEVNASRYWVRHLRETVLFSKGIATILKKQPVIFIEMGPGKALGSFVRAHGAEKNTCRIIPVTRHEQQSGPDDKYLLNALGELWANGVNPGWKEFYKEETRKKVSLPSYSFEMTRYPAIADAASMITSLLPVQEQKEKDMAKWLYAPSWKLALPAVSPAPLQKNTYNLLVKDNSGISEALAKKYRQHGNKSIIVSAGNEFHEKTPFSFTLHPDNEIHLQKLFAALLEYDIYPERIIHCGINDSPEDDLSTIAFGLLSMVKCWQSKPVKGANQLTIITSGLHPVLGNTAIAAGKSVAIGLSKVMSQEFPGLNIGHIDIDLSETNDPVFFDSLFDETRLKQNGKIISLRNGKKWERHFERIETAKSPGVIKNGGVYLVTGGTGDFSYHIALYLVRSVHAKLVLIGRTSLTAQVDTAGNDPAAEEWKRKVARIRSLQQESNDVLYFDADIADTAAIMNIVSMAEEKFGKINGVFHAAGVVRGESINTLTELRRIDFENQFRPKVKGLQTLEQIFAQREPDFCLITSSLSAVLGGLGLGAYATANAVMDYYIGSRGSKNWISVNFDGMSFNINQNAEMSVEEVIQVIENVLPLKNIPQVIVSTSDLQKRLDKWIYAKTGQTEKNNIQNIQPVFDASGSVEDALIGLWENFFGKPVAITDDFFDLGGDSLKGLTLINRMEALFEIKLPVREFFDKSTVKNLADFIRSAKEKVTVPPLPVADMVNEL